MTHSQNSADLHITESARTYTGHVPDFGPYSVTTNSQERFEGKSNKIKFKCQENSAAKERRMVW